MIAFYLHWNEHQEYPCVLNTSHTVLGDMPDFYQKLVCITRHVIQFYQRPGWNTEHTNSLLMWQWHHFCFEVTREGLRPGWNCRHGKLFTQRPGWNKRILRKIQCVLIKSPVTCIQDQRVLGTNKKDNLWLLNCNTVYIGFCDYGYSGKSGFSDR